MTAAIFVIVIVIVIAVIAAAMVHRLSVINICRQWSASG
jgi:hypothetical protein